MGNLIAKIRERYNLTQDQLAKKITISREYINKMETGKMPISPQGEKDRQNERLKKLTNKFA